MSQINPTEYKDTSTPAGEPITPNVNAPAVSVWQPHAPTTDTGRQLARDLTKRINQLYAQLVLAKAHARQFANDGTAGELSLFDFSHEVNTLIDYITEAQNAIAPMRDMPNQIYSQTLEIDVMAICQKVIGSFDGNNPPAEPI